MRRVQLVVIWVGLVGAACSSPGSTGGTDTTVPMTLTDGSTTTLVGQSMTGEGPDNPMPVGEGHVVGGWDLRVLVRGADEAPVLFVNPDGTFLVGVGVATGWLGEVNPAQLPVLSEDVRFLALGADGQEVSAETEGCPDPLPWAESGRFPEGNVCFRLPPAAADEIQLIAESLGDAPPHRAYFSTDASPEMRCYGGACPVRYLQGPELTHEEFLATDIGQILEATFIGGDAEAENGAYLASQGFSIVSDSLVLGYRNGRPVSDFQLEGDRVVSWGIGDGSAGLVSGNLSAARWQPVMPLDPEATTVPIQVPGGACDNEVVTEIRFIEVVEADSTVQVVVWTSEKPWPGQICAGVGVLLDADVRLTDPLGDRVLIDAGIFPAVNTSLQCPLWDEDLPDQVLPEAVAAAREAIYLAALYCDWAVLEEMAMASGGIGYGEGGVGLVGDPVPYWRDSLDGILEGKHPLWYLAGVLELPYTAVEGDDGQVLFYAWPAVAYEDEPTAAEWDELRALYPEARIDVFRTSGEGYAGGFSVAVWPDGTWYYALVMPAE